MIYGCPDRSNKRFKSPAGACPASSGRSKPAGKPSRARRRRSAEEVATAGRLLAKLAQIPDVRGELVERVRREIAEGIYETPARIERTIDRLTEELFTDEASRGSVIFHADEDA